MRMCKKDSFVVIESKLGKIEKKIIDKYNAVYWTVFLIGKCCDNFLFLIKNLS